VADEAILRDLDRPEEYERWRPEETADGGHCPGQG
jgi:hypothetical protein